MSLATQAARDNRATRGTTLARDANANRANWTYEYGSIAANWAAMSLAAIKEKIGRAVRKPVCEKSLVFPQICTVLCLLILIPVTVWSGDRAFSTLSLVQIDYDQEELKIDLIT